MNSQTSLTTKKTKEWTPFWCDILTWVYGSACCDPAHVAPRRVSLQGKKRRSEKERNLALCPSPCKERNVALEKKTKPAPVILAAPPSCPPCACACLQQAAPPPPPTPARSRPCRHCTRTIVAHARPHLGSLPPATQSWGTPV
jgi:hypothetical protein